MKNKILKYAAVTLFGSFSPFALSAAETATQSSSGISDSLMLGLMLAVIIVLILIVYALSESIQSISKLKTHEEKSNSGPIIKAIALLLFSSSAASVFAAEETATAVETAYKMGSGTFWILLSTIVFLALVILVLFRSLQTIIKVKRGVNFQEEAEETSSIFSSIGNVFVDRVPVEEEESVMLDHEYDGIRELDNNLPPWWKYMFYATIIFSIIYLIRFEITGDGLSGHEEYMVEMEAAVAQKAATMADAGEAITEETAVYLVDAPSLEKGGNIYKGNCATCHGQLGEGGAGPNLTDEYWLHGGSIKDVFSVIKYGVPAKGMIAWESQFSPAQLQEVASYILSLKGTNPPNGKAPQGEIYVATSEGTIAIDSSLVEDLIENPEALEDSIQ